MKRTLFCAICWCMVLALAACAAAGPSPTFSAQNTAETSQTERAIYLDSSCSTKERVADLLSRMTLAGKAGQMVQAEQGPVNEKEIAELGLGSVFSGGGSVPNGVNTVENWNSALDSFQEAALSRTLKIPILYGVDAVHGHNTVYGAVIFPQNIGIGAANDPELTKQMGVYVAEEMKMTGILWNFGPCVAVAQDPRWGRTYESCSSDPAIVSDLASAYVAGLQEAGVLATAKHYVADGGTTYGTGENGYPLDRGDAQMSEELLRAIHLAPYKRLVDEGIQCVMVSFSSYNGVKMHENEYLITEVLKGELGFSGFVISDYEAIHELDAPNFDAQVAAAVNAGVDMLMEPNKYKKAIEAIISGVEKGVISQQRVDDAVSRILTVKFNLGLFDDPYLEDMSLGVDELGSAEARAAAEKLVEKSQVLLKNEGGILPFKPGQKIYVIGPAADNIGVQCGGWTITWQGAADAGLVPGTSVLEALNACADEYGLEIITDKARVDEADIVLLAVGEKPYAEYEGDTADLSLTGTAGLRGNADAIAEAAGLGKPVVTLIVAGRNVMIDEYIDDWDAAVMCYLPGSEGGGVVSPLVGKAAFTGRLPMPWYRSVTDIGKDDADLLFELGYGLSG